MTEEPLLTLAEVARRLDVPEELIRRRIEAGDIQAERVEGSARVEYLVRLGDLGIEAADPRFHSAGQSDDRGDEIVIEAYGERSADVFATGVSVTPDQQPVPGPGTAGAISLGGGAVGGPLNEVAGMAIDSRALVAGLLDRWERTLEQRIYAEQRQRFEAELVARQNLVKQLQLEAQAARAEQSAALAARDLIIAERDRQLSERERDLAEALSQAPRRWRWPLGRRTLPG